MGSFAPHGHARIDPHHPRALGFCDLCGFMYVHSDLRWEVQWKGNKIQKTGFLVCPTCFDMPNPTLRPKVLPPDPVPILNARSNDARPGDLYTEGDSDALVTESGNTPYLVDFADLVAENGNLFVSEDNTFVLTAPVLHVDQFGYYTMMTETGFIDVFPR